MLMGLNKVDDKTFDSGLYLWITRESRTRFITVGILCEDMDHLKCDVENVFDEMYVKKWMLR